MLALLLILNYFHIFKIIRNLVNTLKMIINTKKLQDRDAGKLVDGAQYQGQVHTERRHISFYDEPPHDTIGIYEFQKTAVNRLQVLKRI